MAWIDDDVMPLLDRVPAGQLLTRDQSWRDCGGSHELEQLQRPGEVAAGQMQRLANDPVRRVAAWSTCGPHATGAERFVAVCNGASFAQVAGAILGKQACVQNPDKDEVASDPLLGTQSPAPQLSQGRW